MIALTILAFVGLGSYGLLIGQIKPRSGALTSTTPKDRT